MKAIVYRQYGSPDVMSLEEVQKPVPGTGEVLVKVHAASINAADRLLLNGASLLVRMMTGGISKPKRMILGMDVAGRVEAVGSGVTQFKAGDEVYGDLTSLNQGSFAEYVTAPEKFLALKPANLSFEEAASIPLAATTSLQGLRDKKAIQRGQQVLITGASGGCGVFAVQLAKHFGAEVTAVCSTSKMDMVRSIGADHVIDYKREDVTKLKQQYDLILDMAAYRPFAEFAPILKPNGLYLIGGGSHGLIIKAMLTARFASKSEGKRFEVLSQKPNQQDLVTMKELAEAGKIVPVIDRCYSLAEVPDAMRYFSDGHTRGKIVIGVAQ